MPPGAPARQGRDAIRAAHGTPRPGFSLTSVEVDGRDGLAYDRGTWSVAVPVAGTTVADTGNYLAVLRKQDDGSWLFAIVIWNNDEPLPQLW